MDYPLFQKTTVLVMVSIALHYILCSWLMSPCLQYTLPHICIKLVITLANSQYYVLETCTAHERDKHVINSSLKDAYQQVVMVKYEYSGKFWLHNLTLLYNNVSRWNFVALWSVTIYTTVF